MEPLLLLLVIPAAPVPQKLLYLALVVPPVVWFCASVAHGHFIARTPLDWPITLLLAMIGLSQAIGRDADYSLPKVAFLAWGVVAFQVVARYAHSERELRQAVTVFSLLGSWMVALGLFATSLVVKMPLLASVSYKIPDWITPLWGFSMNPNNAGGALVLFIPLYLALLAAGWAGAGLRRAASLAGLVVAIAALILTQNRGAWLGSLVACFALAAWRIAPQRPRLALGMVGTAFLVAAIAPQVAAAGLAGQAAENSPLESLVWRQEIWADVLPAIRDYPWAGLGIVRIREALPALYPAMRLSDFTLMMKETHQAMLEVGLYFGLPGLVAYLGLWCGAGWLLVAAHRTATDPWLRALTAGLSAGLAAHLVFSLTDSVLINAKVGMVFWLALGLAAGALRVARGQARMDSVDGEA